MDDIEIPANSTGISCLFNPDTISNSVKLDDTEKNIIDDTSLSFSNKFLDYADPVEEYKNRAERINNNTNILPSSLSEINDVNESNDFMFDIDDDIKDELNVINSMINNSTDMNGSQTYIPQQSKIPQFNYNESHDSDSQKIVQSIIKEESYNDNETVLLDQDKKILLLQKIEDLLEDLKCDGVDVSAIPEVSFKSSCEELNLVYRQLIIKNNRDKMKVLAEESFLIFAKGLEKVFDGEKDYFGYKPDLTDFSNTMRTKLRRYRFETTSMASDIVESYELSMRSRLFLEIGASAISHSISRKSKHKQNLYDENDINDAMHEIRNYD
jgi:hypothetical protein